MKVLLISYHFPPDPAVGSLRTGRIAAALREAGHEVQVIGPSLSGMPAETGQATAVHRIRRWRNGREIALAARNVLRRNRTPASEANGPVEDGGYVTAENVPQWKRFLVAMALLPDDQQGFILPALGHALRLQARHRFDLLYTSGPPHSAHVTGLFMKKLTHMRWAAEFRDPWTDNAMQPRYARSPTAQRMKGWLERRTLTGADHIVAVSEAAGRLFADKVPAHASRVIVVRNGIASTDPPPPELTPGTTRITYLGNLYHRRDPRPLLQALAALYASGRLGAAAVEVDFYGQCRWYHGVSIEEMARSLGLADRVRFHDPIPQDQTPAIMARSNLLLLLAQDQPLQVPQKLYDYFGARRPILAFADPDGETARMLESAGGHYVVHDQAADRVEAVLLRALRGEPDSAPRFDPLVEWSTEREFGRLVSLLGAGSDGRAPVHQLLRDRDTRDLENVTQTTVRS